MARSKFGSPVTGSIGPVAGAGGDFGTISALGLPSTRHFACVTMPSSGEFATRSE
ncbi:hypothetical protein [Kribbella sp. VKM Ac-2568]|uniref:hypothetical protein n=1 Tax=Kribbella sp. VKM Ac-2568 TaxID=2512219 RepID=UPI00130519FE|nr:hypothetical protein [Kribbella sp. VKM Ac-2568]